MNYIDDYPTCEDTYVTLRIYTGEMAPEFVTRMLGVKPSDTLTKGQIAKGRKKPAILNGWFLSSQGEVDSLDSRRHIDWLLQNFEGKDELLRKVAAESQESYVSVFWSSKSGHGGPRLSQNQMAGLLRLGLDIDHDIYI
ncbi:DUF4279 domain-containing protein [Simiduia aestuariiviva]|uniref:DUF4279 domain-containing protein n=1 Tax=Simiduia aestuariiviva TaxID=1510459 RepID=A0A839UU28_9GAMM|nr:DUF4279 domain-containing protein [Simiduia aestuariiviva]MBB3169476.1 hypothetical protein [Simiduia aestuariiviva]